jgi:hypothetical protein
VGKHYGPGSERIGDPIGNNSHAATVRQVLRFFLKLEQGKLVSPAASKTLREVFESPDLPHDNIKFVKALAGRDVQIIRKWGTREDWYHDAAVIKGPGRHYILVALTKHPEGDNYLEELAKAVDDLMRAEPERATRERAFANLLGRRFPIGRASKPPGALNYSHGSQAGSTAIQQVGKPALRDLRRAPKPFYGTEARKKRGEAEEMSLTLTRLVCRSRGRRD